MVKYDYSLDIGQSMETDEKIKQKEKEEPQGCCTTPEEPLEIGDEKEEKQEQENPQKEKPKEEKSEAQNSQKEASRKVEIKPISFEKAKLISDFEGEKKEKSEPAAPNSQKEVSGESLETKEEKPEQDDLKSQEDDAPEEEQKDPEEDEKDVNEFLEDSFSKETKNYEIYNNKPKEEAISKKRSWKLPATIIIIIFLIGFFGYFYITAEHSPTGTVTAAPEIEPLIIVPNITRPPADIPNITEPVEQKNITKEPEQIIVTEEPEQNISDALEMLSIALKDQ